MSADLRAISQYVFEVAKQAGEAIMPFHFREQDIELEFKEDDSPLTAADMAAHQAIVSALRGYAVGSAPVPILSEESENATAKEKMKWETYWCVDPLDGTQEFIRQREEFTVNIALIDKQKPIIGVIYAPVNREGYVAWQGGGAYEIKDDEWKPLKTARVHEPLRVIASRRHGLENIQSILDNFQNKKMISRGSALKFCEVAKGGADLFLRATQTSEWDNAAGQCIAEEAGAKVFHFDFSPVRYNTSLSFLTNPLIVVGDQNYHWFEVLAKIPR